MCARQRKKNKFEKNDLFNKYVTITTFKKKKKGRNDSSNSWLCFSFSLSLSQNYLRFFCYYKFFLSNKKKP